MEMPDAERPDQSAWNIKVAAASVSAKLVYYFFSAYELMWLCSKTESFWSKCVCVLSRNQNTCFCLGSIVQKTVTRLLAPPLLPDDHFPNGISTEISNH